MTDFEYDCLQKKRLANQARYRKNGSKSKKCSLPSDRLTNKQWKERCGAVMNYSFGSPINWENFKQMPERIQAEYITNLQKKYNATATDLAKMFGVKPLTVTRHVISKNLSVTFHRGKSMTALQKDAWLKFLNPENSHGEESRETACIEPEAPISYEVQEKELKNDSDENVESAHGMSMRRISLMFDGVINVDAIANSLKLIIGNQSNGSVEIVCHLG